MSSFNMLTVGVLFLCFWVHILTVTLPASIYQETSPAFEDLRTRLESLSSGLRHTETETFSELELTKKNISSLGAVQIV